jgi:ABC-type sugar transport system ATPase subunit
VKGRETEGMSEIAIHTEGIVKEFSGVRVLHNVDFSLEQGEIHAVIGENGAGKSTLMNIIAGVFKPTEGSIFVRGEQVVFHSPYDAIAKRIALIHQEPLIFSDLDIAENIFAGHTRKSGRLTVGWKDIYRQAQELLDSLEVQLDPKRVMKNMSIADQQMVEIVSALSQNAQVIIMDEPTASLTPSEVGNLFSIVRKLQGQGKSFIFISHRLDEILEISERITVLRDGYKVGVRERAETDKQQLIEMMIGREMKDHISKENVEIGEVKFEVENLESRGVFQDISLHVRAGEILGIAGLVGAGRSEVARALFGLDPIDSGTVKIDGQEVVIDSPRTAIRHGLAYIPEDRQLEGLFLPYKIAANITYASPGQISKKGWLLPKKEKEIADEYGRKLGIRMRDCGQRVQELSGGNQQKVVLAKWLLTGPDILILDEPTRGIDVGAKEEVYKLINELSRSGKAVIMISSELAEITGLSDRVIVLKEGRITGVFEGEQINDINIMKAATKNLAEVQQ